VAKAPQDRWCAWLALDDVASRRSVAALPGLYRVRDADDGALLYVGQSAVLRSRLTQLAVLYRPEMPFSDPHTAAPCLWALRHVLGTRFEVSARVLDGGLGPIARRTAECVVISEYRRAAGRSPTANFGRMPDGWVKSSGNNAGLLASGRQRRGYRDPAAARAPDHPSVLDTARSPLARDWAGLPWSPWSPPDHVPPVRGVYRLRVNTHDNAPSALAYIGQGAIRRRVRAHVVTGAAVGHRQQPHFSGALQVSWAELPDATSQQLLEVECDLIAGHVLRLGRPPPAQFLG
jgi:hypothetical protein